jgi:hypothetical protein
MSARKHAKSLHLIDHECRACPTCERLAATAHPLAIGAVVTILHIRNGCLAVESVGTILRPASEPNVYFVRFNCRSQIVKRLVFTAYQRNPEEWLAAVHAHVAYGAAGHIATPNDDNDA